MQNNSTMPWSIDRWGRLIAGCAVVSFACLAVAHSPLWLLALFGVGGNLLVSAVADRCPVQASLKWAGALEREELYAPGGIPRHSITRVRRARV